MATERRRLQSMERICRETRQRLGSRDGDITSSEKDDGGDDGEVDDIELQVTLRRQQEAVDSQRKVLDDLEFQLLEVQHCFVVLLMMLSFYSRHRLRRLCLMSFFSVFMLSEGVTQRLHPMMGFSVLFVHM